MTDETFLIGEVVYLKSGSPPLTVSFIDTCGDIDIVWISPEGVQVAQFPPICLTHIRPNFDDMETSNGQ
jgi:uncharacterized protein YodC (DUF2158 family)